MRGFRSIGRCLVATLAVPLLALAGCGGGGGGSDDLGPVTWSLDGDPPTVTKVTGGPWTLTQLAQGNPNPSKVLNKSFGYDANFATANDGKTSPMSPYYFPVIHGTPDDLQGYFDWRPKDINEGVAAAHSTDGGQTWQFQQLALVLTNAVPVNPQSTDPDASLADNGFGHGRILRITDPDPVPTLTPAVGIAPTPTIAVNGLPTVFLYNLDRSTDAVDRLGLIVSALSPTASAPLNGAKANVPLAFDFTDELNVIRTVGLRNPDGILAEVPGATKPLIVLYIQKNRNADATGSTRLPGSQQCRTQPYTPSGSSSPNPANHDIVTVRVAQTTDGVNFIDTGPVFGLNDSTTTSYVGTRWIAPGGTMLNLGGGRYGLFFAGGNCMDADSDAFHYVGYAETTDPSFLEWTLINDINNPIAEIEPHTVPVDGVPTTVPAQTPVVGPALDPFMARVYSPSVVILDPNTVLMTFAGYHVQDAASGLLDYRNILTVHLKSSRPLPLPG